MYKINTTKEFTGHFTQMVSIEKMKVLQIKMFQIIIIFCNYANEHLANYFLLLNKIKSEKSFFILNANVVNYYDVLLRNVDLKTKKFNITLSLGNINKISLPNLGT